jgi:hypothetical protein
MAGKGVDDGREVGKGRLAGVWVVFAALWPWPGLESCVGRRPELPKVDPHT